MRLDLCLAKSYIRYSFVSRIDFLMFFKSRSCTTITEAPCFKGAPVYDVPSCLKLSDCRVCICLGMTGEGGTAPVWIHHICPLAGSQINRDALMPSRPQEGRCLAPSH